MSDKDLRQVRAGKNQALFRALNQQLVELDQTFDLAVETGVFVCECARIDCIETIEMTLADYEAVRADPHTFFVAPSDGHWFPEVERVVAARDRYYVVEKIGAAASIVEETADA